MANWSQIRRPFHYQHNVMACYKTVISCKVPEGWCGKSEPFGEETSKLKHTVIKPHIKFEVPCSCTLSKMIEDMVGPCWYVCLSLEFNRRVSFHGFHLCPEDLPLSSQLCAVGIWLWVIRVVFSEDIRAPVVRPSCVNCPPRDMCLY